MYGAMLFAVLLFDIHRHHHRKESGGCIRFQNYAENLQQFHIGTDGTVALTSTRSSTTSVSSTAALIRQG